VVFHRVIVLRSWFCSAHRSQGTLRGNPALRPLGKGSGACSTHTHMSNAVYIAAMRPKPRCKEKWWRSECCGLLSHGGVRSIVEWRSIVTLPQSYPNAELVDIDGFVYKMARDSNGRGLFEI
jgi:hypothetical protein